MRMDGQVRKNRLETEAMLNAFLGGSILSKEYMNPILTLIPT
jgi:hypothetical protein